MKVNPPDPTLWIRDRAYDWWRHNARGRAENYTGFTATGKIPQNPVKSFPLRFLRYQGSSKPK